MMTQEEIMQKYGFIEPMPGYIVIKEVQEESNNGLVKAGQTESKAYGTIIAIPESGSYLQLGDLVCYNEYEGQELFKFGMILEDHLIVIKIENILLKINSIC